MSEDWAAIAADVTAAIADIGFDVSVRRKDMGPQTPWDEALTVAETLTIRVIDAKPWRSLIPGGSEIHTGRSLLCAPGENVPSQGDRVTVRGKEHEVLVSRAVAPGGVDLFHIVELNA